MVTRAIVARMIANRTRNLKRYSFLGAVILLLSSSHLAWAQDTTASQQHRPWVPFRGVHVSGGGGELPYLDYAVGGAQEYKVMFTLRRFPEWSVGVARSFIGDVDTTGYVAQYPSGVPSFAKPWMASSAIGIRAERRWSRARRWHTMAALTAGSLKNAHEYYRFESGVLVSYKEHVSHGPFGEASGGVEFNIARWARINLLVGYRLSRSMNAPQARGSNAGRTSMLSLAIGSF